MGILERPFAAIYEKSMEQTEKKWLRAERQKMLSDLTGEILEIGAGTGANFDHYSPQANVTAIEPSKHFFKRAQTKIINNKTNIKLEQTSAEKLPFADNTFDTIVATLVFCSIPDPIKAFTEIYRVTRPNGSLLLIEHVQAQTPGKRLILNLWNPCQKFIAGGCNMNRDTINDISSSGFQIEDVQVLSIEMGLSPHVYIRATSTKQSS